MTGATLFTERLDRAVSAMKDAGVDALLLCPGADMLYLSGFEHGHAGERLLALVLRRDGSSSWIAPEMNVRQVEPHLLPGQNLKGWSDAEGYLPDLRAALSDAGNIAFDDEARSAFLLDLAAIAPQAKLRKASTLLRTLRIRKDAAELTSLRAAARTVDETIPEAIALCRPGTTEMEIDQALRAALLKRSPQSTVAFTIIAGGPNGSSPHHENSHRKLSNGDIVILDYGTRLDGYHSDITVTCCVGEPLDPDTRKVYRVVYDAQQAALRAVRPGVACAAIDQAARSVIEAAGYGPQFMHRTGHGLGLQVHEPPFLVAGNNEVLDEGMVFSIEPGIYLSGRFGVRLEVIACVTPDGVSLINAPSAPELPIVKD
jgi:Xaa-Pro aminopeptidase